MSGPLAFGVKFVEKFFCECGAECKPVLLAGRKGSAKGTHWQCANGHVNRQYTRKERVEKR